MLFPSNLTVLQKFACEMNRRRGGGGEFNGSVVATLTPRPVDNGNFMKHVGIVNVRRGERRDLDGLVSRMWEGSSAGPASNH